MDKKKILILEPDRDVSELFARALESRRDCKCYHASREEEAFDLLQDISFHMILADLSMIMAGDFSALKKIKRLFPLTTIVVDGYVHQKELLCKALSLGAHGTIFKPIKVEMLRKKVDELNAPSAVRLS